MNNLKFVFGDAPGEPSDSTDIAEVMESISAMPFATLGERPYSEPAEVFTSDFMKLPPDNPEERKKTAQKKTVKPGNIYQIYAELNGFNPQMYRRILIKSDETLMTLVSLLIIGFNGDGSHLYSFTIPTKQNKRKALMQEGKSKPKSIHI